MSPSPGPPTDIVRMEGGPRSGSGGKHEHFITLLILIAWPSTRDYRPIVTAYQRSSVNAEQQNTY
jgi:hypothetical protein